MENWNGRSEGIKRQDRSSRKEIRIVSKDTRGTDNYYAMRHQVAQVKLCSTAELNEQIKEARFNSATRLDEKQPNYKKWVAY